MRFKNLVFSVFLFFTSFNQAFAQFPRLPKRILPQCDPTLPPADPNACGVKAFVELIRNLIDYFTIIVIPIAVLMLVWAGFVIITAGGSVTKVQKGKAIITTAVIGIVITLLAGAAVGIIYNLFTGTSAPAL